MFRRTRNLAAAFAIVAVLAFLLFSWVLESPAGPSDPLGGTFGSLPPSAPPAVAESSAPDTLQSSAPPASTDPPSPTQPPDDLNSYAIALPELQGLPPDAKPGSRLELWVAWEPPVVKRLKVQRLLRNVTLEKIAPSVTGESPPVALLQVRDDQFEKLLWGDQYGRLSVAMVEG